MLAFSSITDAGFLVLAVALAGRFGMAGAVIGASAHALAKSLLFATLAGPERDAPVTLASRGLAVRHPLAAAGFVAGALTALGVPSTQVRGPLAHLRDRIRRELGVPRAAHRGDRALGAGLRRVIALCWWGRTRPPARRPPAP